MSWKSNIQTSFETHSHLALKNCPAGLEVSFYLEGEASDFVRFSKSKVRQSTAVEQAKVTLTLQSDKKLTRIAFPMTGQMEEDRKRFLYYFGKAQSELPQLPDNPFRLNLASSGSTSKNQEAQTPTADFIISQVQKDTTQDDFVGYMASGPLLRGIINSKGTQHWYSTDIYFVDYSLFEDKNAVTANVAGSDWNQKSWEQSLSDSRGFLHQMRKPRKKLDRGEYRTYLAPGAVAELLSTACWGGFSQGAFRQGQSGLRLLHEGTEKFSNLVTLTDNYDLGLCQPFNSTGELVPQRLTLVEQGQNKNLITSSKSAAEYKVASTGADDYEMPLSLEMAPGTLSRQDVFKKIGTGLYLSNLHYVNWSDPKTARMTGMTRYACFWVENGDIVGPLHDMRFDVSLYDVFGKQLVELTNFQETMVNNLTYESRGLGGKKLPGALIDGFKLTL